MTERLAITVFDKITLPANNQARLADNNSTDSVTQEIPATNMAHNFHLRNKNEGEPLTPKFVSLAGIIEFQPNRKKVSGPWRSMQSSDLDDKDHTGCNSGYSPSTIQRVPPLLAPSVELPDTLSTMPTRNSPRNHQAVLPDQASSSLVTPTLSEGGRVRFDHLKLICSEIDQYEQFFRSLPDPSRLDDQVGDFDGQVAFIGHQNRDISAHQWSSKSSQWVNIGRYAHKRGRVEGSLASDSFGEIGVSQNPLGFFILAAEAREKTVLENDRAKESAYVHQSSSSSLISEGVPSTALDNEISNCHTTEVLKQYPQIESQRTVRKAYLDDPFVASTKFTSTGTGICPQARNDVNEPRGDLDLEYQFPSNLKPSDVPWPEFANRSSSQERFLERRVETNTNPLDEAFIPSRMAQITPQEINIEVEAENTAPISPNLTFSPQKIPVTGPSTEVRFHGKIVNRPYELDERALKVYTPIKLERTTGRNYVHLQSTAQPLLPPPGFTVANPHRQIPTMNSSVPIYTDLQRLTLQSDVTAPAAMNHKFSTAALRFSDPDSQRQRYEYEIANGLGKQPPTPQHFAGPFFTDSKPTANHPTVSLSVQVSEEEKLVTWFRNGHRPARQQDYARSLIYATTPHARGQNIGVIGETIDKQLIEPHNNTPLVIPLYENLSEYLEEYCSGSGKSYFTRSWKIAPQRLRDAAVGSSSSYFEKATSMPPKAKVDEGEGQPSCEE